MTPAGLSDWYDVIVIGGGITGAGVAREAAAAGLDTLLVEQNDYAWGTSGRSSKMVHGGLRYLAGGHLKLTREAVRERQRMLDQLPGLVDRMRYVMPHYRKGFPGPWLFGRVLWLYDHFAGERYRHRIDRTEIQQWLPGLTTEGLKSATGFSDAVTEDARLVLRLLEEARHLGATTRNYTKVTRVERADNQTWTATLEDRHPDGDSNRQVSASLIINATGAWADRLWRQPHRDEHIRPLRGSHLILPFGRLPVSVSLTISHPVDRRPVFIFPWLGRTVVGTTDLDHGEDLDQEPRISPAELDYLLEAVGSVYPGAAIGPEDIISTWAGVRPVVTEGGRRSPSKESREHVIWAEDGLISVAGGKLTTFRLIAREALLTGSPWLAKPDLSDPGLPLFRPAPERPRPEGISHLNWRRLRGYYGPELDQVLAAGPLEPVGSTHYLWAEIHWSVRQEAVVHLDDLMLRRTRLGLLVEDGARALLPRLRQQLQGDLGWTAERWQHEEDRYLALWQQACSPPREQPGS